MKEMMFSWPAQNMVTESRMHHESLGNLPASGTGYGMHDHSHEVWPS